MVKSLSKLFFSVLVMGITLLIIGCSVDLLGLFGSNDVDERLKEKDQFRYLNGNERTPPSLPDDFDFIVLADTHVEGDITDLKKIKTVLDNDVTGNIKFMTILGDITQTGVKEDITEVMNFTRTLPVPCYPVIGNHDIYFGNWSSGWKEYIGSTRYKIEGGDITLLVLDSANAFMGKEQIDWLEKQLKTAKKNVFVLTHSDFFVQDKIKIQQLYDPAERARIMSMLRDKCDIVLTGHSHERVEKEFGDVKFISIEDYKSTQTYCLVKVTPSGVSYEFKKL